MLFGKKAKEKSTDPSAFRLTVFGADMQVVFCDLIHRLPLPESLVVACSEEFFNDPKPCEIHRRAVSLRIYAELIELLPAGQLLTVDELPPQAVLYLHALNPVCLRLDPEKEKG